MAVNAAIGSALVRREMRTIGEGKQQGERGNWKKNHNSCLLFHHIVSGAGKQEAGLVTALCPR